MSMLSRSACVGFLRNLEEIGAGACLVAVIAITGYNIVNRYVLQQAAAWAPEIAGFIFTWVVFLGVSAAAKRGMHVSVRVLVDRLPSRWQAVLGTAVDIVLAAFFAYAAWLALKIAISSAARVSPVTGLSYSYVYASVVASFAAICVRQVFRLSAHLRGRPGTPSD
jgi:TRAP-type C4-dicarboxylate transport system permease small subunit